MGAWEQIPARSKLCSFSQTSGFPQSPRRRLQQPSPHFPALGCAGAGLCCCSLHSCRDAGAGGGTLPLLPWDPSTGKTHSSIPAGIFLCSGECGDGESPQHCLSHPASSPEDAQTPQGCLTQISFAFNCIQAMRFLPCRRVFGLLQPLAQPLCPIWLQIPWMVAGHGGPMAPRCPVHCTAPLQHCAASCHSKSAVPGGEEALQSPEAS